MSAWLNNVKTSASKDASQWTLAPCLWGGFLNISATSFRQRVNHRPSQRTSWAQQLLKIVCPQLDKIPPVWVSSSPILLKTYSMLSHTFLKDCLLKLPCSHSKVPLLSIHKLSLPVCCIGKPQGQSGLEGLSLAISCKAGMHQWLCSHSA